jgi:hypothetical protein
MPADVAHFVRATEPIMAPTVRSPRSILVPDVAPDGRVTKHDEDTTVWLRSWYTLDSPMCIGRPKQWFRDDNNCLWYEFSSSKGNDPLFGHWWRMGKRKHHSRPPLKFRYVVCHYGRPFSWHWIEAVPIFGPKFPPLAHGPTPYGEPRGPVTGWQEMVLFTTVGSSSGSLTAQVHSFRARSVPPGLFNTTASAMPAVKERAECYSSAAADVRDFTGARELTFN